MSAGMARYFGAPDAPGRLYGLDHFVPTVWPCARCGEDVRGTDWACSLCRWGAVYAIPGQYSCDHVMLCGPCYRDPARAADRIRREGYQPALFEAAA